MAELKAHPELSQKKANAQNSLEAFSLTLTHENSKLVVALPKSPDAQHRAAEELITRLFGNDRRVAKAIATAGASGLEFLIPRTNNERNRRLFLRAHTAFVDNFNAYNTHPARAFPIVVTVKHQQVSLQLEVRYLGVIVDGERVEQDFQQKPLSGRGSGSQGKPEHLDQPVLPQRPGVPGATEANQSGGPELTALKSLDRALLLILSAARIDPKQIQQTLANITPQERMELTALIGGEKIILEGESIREVILRQMRAVQVSRNALHTKISEQVTRSHLYSFLDGSTDMSTKHLEAIFRALNITLCGLAR